MKIAGNLSLILALTLGTAAAGCAAGGSDDDDLGGDDTGGDDSGGGGDEVKPLDAAGAYSLRSNFDLAANAPGKAGQVINLVIDMTDDPDDPTGWILDQ